MFIRYLYMNFNKIRVFLLFILILVLLSNFLFSQNWLQNIDRSKEFNYIELQKSFKDYWKDKKPYKGSGYKQYKRLEWMLEQRLYNSNKLPDLVSAQNQFNQYLVDRKPHDKMLSKADWKPLGPNTKPAPAAGIPSIGLGRLNCIAVDPTNNNVIWVGSSSGGVWKSTDAGNTWVTFSFSNFMSLGISDIQISSKDHNIVYLSTGDADAAGYLGVNFSFSIGIIKTTDGGTTWSTTNLAYTLPQNVLVNKMLIHPQIPNILYAATNKGIYKTTDGGNSWLLFNSDVCRDLQFKFNDPAIMYGAFDGGIGSYSIQKFTDATGWVKMQEFTDVGRIALAASKNNPNYIYALCCNTYMFLNSFHSLWRTTDDGKTWKKMSDKSSSPNYLAFDASGQGQQGQGLYDLCIATNPSNKEEVYIGGVNIWKSINGGTSFTCNAEGYTNEMTSLPWIHPDIHALEFGNNGWLYSCTDGGLNRTKDNGSTWSDLSNGLQITQFYRISVGISDKNFIMGGSQDNGTHKYNGTTWINLLGGDGMQCLIDYSNKNYIYGTLYNGSVYSSADGGNSFTQNPIISEQSTNESGSWVAPVVIHPTNPQTLYAGFQNVWRSTDRGSNWSKISNFQSQNTIFVIAVSASNPLYIYASSYSKLYKSTNGGTSWVTFTNTSDYITGIAINPTDPKKLWLTQSGYDDGNKVMYFDGSKWTNISGTLPNVPVNCITYQNDSQDRLYIGTDVGVFSRDNGTQDWELFNDGMPNVIINDLQIHYGSGYLRAATYGRGVWETKITDCNLASPVVNISGNTSFCLGDSVRLECSGDYVTYKWNTGQTSKFIFVKTQGSYSVTVSDAKQCNATSDQININVINPPDYGIKIIGKNPFCEGDYIELNVNSFSFKSYLWNTGDTTKKIKVTKPGIYSVVSTTQDGCIKSATAPIDVKTNKLPQTPTITQDQTDKSYLVSTDAVAYLWYLNGVALTNDTNKRIKTKVPGKYSVEISDINGCKAKSTEFEVLTGVNDNYNNNSNVTIIPNPVSDFLTLKLLTVSEIGNLKISIRNLLGQELMIINDVCNSNEYQKQIDISSLNIGSYIIIISENGSLFVNKIIKK